MAKSLKDQMRRKRRKRQIRSSWPSHTTEREIVYNMSVFYFDRWDLAFGDRKDCTTILERIRIFKGDSTRREKFLKYLESKENEKKLKKQKTCFFKLYFINKNENSFSGFSFFVKFFLIKKKKYEFARNNFIY